MRQAIRERLFESLGESIQIVAAWLWDDVEISGLEMFAFPIIDQGVN